MKSGVAVAAATLCACPLVALAQPVTGPYVNLGAGAIFLQNQLLKPNGAHSPLERSYTFDPGFTGEASIGYGLGNGFRVELEGDYTNNRVHGVQFGSPERAGGNEQQYGGFLNALYDFDLQLPIYPYVGIGVGYQAVTLDRVNSSGYGMVINPGGSETNGAFAYQGIAGLSYPLGVMPGLSVTAEYRLMGVVPPAAYDRVGGSSTLSNIINQEALVGLRYAFNAAPPPPPPVEATSVPAPTAARTYLVFFDWDRSDLTDRARQIIAEAAQASTRVQTTRIQVDGYTDSSGDPAYNQRLSVRRAETVAGELVRDGVPRAAIEIQGFGETNPLVKTDKGVREPQNRRVEIIMK